MLDLSYFQNSTSNVQVFTNAGTWQTWAKPRGAKLVTILCVGAGGGGGAGVAGSGGGGGGGACGGQTKAIYQANILPDLLYIQCGIGGAGGIGGAITTSGSAGSISYVTLIPNITSNANLVCVSSATVAGGGTSGSAVNGNGGTAPTAATTANAIFLNLGTFTAAAGLAGAGGPTNANGGSIAPSIFITPGAGGGGTATGGTIRNGGDIQAVLPYFPIVSGGIGANTLNAFGRNGENGIILYKPILYMTGGAGGGNSKFTTAPVTNTGGNGGNGAYGCGGGGGGGGQNFGGAGGNGGDGLIIITTSF